MSAWISIKKKKPPLNREVFVYRPLAHLTSDPPVAVSYRTAHASQSPQGIKHYFDCWCHPTHWMPIPELPKADKR